MTSLNDIDLNKYLLKCIEVARETSEEITHYYVGALVLDATNKIVSRGYKKIIEGTKLTVHAERIALEKAGDLAYGGTLFTTFEPCGKIKGPTQIFKSCAELIVDYKIANVVYGVKDKNQKFIYTGSDYLRKRGVNVVDCSSLEQYIKREAHMKSKK